jgi:hypothetical protein
VHSPKHKSKNGTTSLKLTSSWQTINICHSNSNLVLIEVFFYIFYAVQKYDKSLCVRYSIFFQQF